MDGQRLSQQNFLSQFNIQGGEAERVVTELSIKSKQFNDALAIGQKARGSTSALDNPENQAPRTFANSVTDLTNALDGLFATMGKLIAPQAIAFMDQLKEVLETVTSVLKSMGTPLGTVVTDIVIFGGALGGLIKTGQIVREIFEGIGEAIGLKELAEGTERLTEATEALKGAEAVGAASAVESGSGALIAGMSQAGLGSAVVARRAGEAAVAEATEKAASGLAKVGEGALAAEETVGVASIGLAGIFGTLTSAINPFVIALAGYEFLVRPGVKGLTGAELPSASDTVKGVGTGLSIGARALAAFETRNQHEAKPGEEQSDTHSTGQSVLDLIGSFFKNGPLNDIYGARPEQKPGPVSSRFAREDDAQGVADSIAKEKHDRETTLSTTDDQAIASALGIFNAKNALDAYNVTLNKTLGLTAEERAKHTNGVITDDDIARMKEGQILLERQIEPVANQLRLGEESLNMQRATTADLKTQVGIRNAINAAIEKNAAEGNDPEVQKQIILQEQEKQVVATNNALQETNQQLDEQIARLVTVGTAAQNDLDIAIKRAAFEKKNGVGSFDSLVPKERTAQALQGAQTIIGSDQEIAGALKLKDVTDQINAARTAGLISEDTAAGARQRITAQTLAQVSPYEQLIKLSAQEAQYASAMGPYRDAEIKALQTINQLKDQGIIKDGEDTAQLKEALTELNKDIAQLQKEQNSGFNGFVNKVGEVSDTINNLQTTAAETLSSGLTSAITRTPFNFQQIGQSLVKQGTDLLVSNLLKGTGLAGPDKALQQKIQADQNKIQQIAEARMTIANANITLNQQNAQALGASTGTNLTNPNASNANTLSVRGFGGDDTHNADGSVKTPEQIGRDDLTKAVNTSAPVPTGGPSTQQSIDAAAARIQAGLNPNAANAGVPMTEQPSEVPRSPFGVLNTGVENQIKRPGLFGNIDSGITFDAQKLDAGGRPTADALTQHLISTYGLTREQATGPVGVLGYESGDFKTLQERNPISGRGGYGYAQYTGPRRVAFESYARGQGLDPSSYAANQGFLDKELQGDKAGTIAALKATNNPKDLGASF